MKKGIRLILCMMMIFMLLTSVPVQADIFVDIMDWLTPDFEAAPATPEPTPVPTPTPFSLAPALDRLSPGSMQVRPPTPTPLLTFGTGLPNPGQSISLPTAKPATKAPGSSATKAPDSSATKQPAQQQPKPTAKPRGNGRTPAGKGAELTSFGLYFEELRPKLTDKWYMFTPLDLSMDSVLSYPLVANNQSIVGSIRVTVRGTQLVVECLPAEGVKLNRQFFTLFTDLDAIQTLNVDLLGNQGYAFGQPIDIPAAFGEDRKVILYVNNTADYKANLPGVTAFVPEQHRLFMQNLMPLLD